MSRTTLPSFPGYSRAALTFLRQIVAHNEREWFLARKALYETELRGATAQLVEALNARMQTFAPEYVADPKRAIPRIHRDLRFTEDKRPYKHNVAAVFPLQGGDRNACGSFYASLSAESVDVVAGVQRPTSRFLRAIREAIDADPRELRRILRRKAVQDRFGGLDGPRLVHVPKGFDRDHPAADALRCRTFCLRAALPTELANTSRLLSELVFHFRAAAPFVRFLDRAYARASETA